jgi:hypothetical protein
MVPETIFRPSLRIPLLIRLASLALFFTSLLPKVSLRLGIPPPSQGLTVFL